MTFLKLAQCMHPDLGQSKTLWSLSKCWSTDQILGISHVGFIWWQCLFERGIYFKLLFLKSLTTIEVKHIFQIFPFIFEHGVLSWIIHNSLFFFFQASSKCSILLVGWGIQLRGMLTDNFASIFAGSYLLGGMKEVNPTNYLICSTPFMGWDTVGTRNKPIQG